MKCIAQVNVKMDKPIWISREHFFAHFNQDDFNCRKLLHVPKTYLRHWFDWPAQGLPQYILPVIQFVSRGTQFINGRHRTAVLIEQMEWLPMALLMPFPRPKDTRDQILSRPLDLDEPLQLPELAIVDGPIR